MPPPPSALGRKIRNLRKKMGLSLDEFALKTESSKSYVWELENKPVARPSGEKIAKFAHILQVTSEFLLDENRTDPTPDERDQAFFRQYQGADPDVKAKIVEILKVLDDKDGKA